MKIARIATVPFFLYNHLRGQIEATIAAGHEVVLISSGGEESEWLQKMPGVRFHEINIPRKISLLSDLLALWNLFLFFRQERFDIVHSTTPKAGMLSAIAGFFARVPVRLHTFTGQPWVEMQGMMRAIAKTGDKLTAHFDTLCYADSFSQRDFIISEGVCNERKILVLGSGSLAGVDISRFNPEKWAGSREATLKELDIPAKYKVITFIGRLTRDKGLEELMAAFSAVCRSGQKCMLLLVGPDEAEDGVLSNSVKNRSDPNMRFIGYSAQPERYLAVTDIFCLPSYREGFGNVAIEAAAMGVPTVGTNIVGLRDAVVDGETGLLVPPKDSATLASALISLLKDEKRRIEMGEKARSRSTAQFDARRVNAAVLDEYQRLTSARPHQ